MLPLARWCLLLFAGCPVPEDKESGAARDSGTPPLDTADTGDSAPPPPDSDGDGWLDEEDCDDGDPLVHPGATEVCNHVDDDCDGDTDEDVATTVYPDGDGDGHGDPAGTTGCAGDAGTAEAGDDCDDTDGTVFPGATEACDDGVDQDCDPGSCRLSGEIDLSASADVTIYDSLAWEGIGEAVAGVGDLDGDGIDDIAIGSANAYVGDSAYYGALYLIRGGSSFPDDTADAWVIVGSSEDHQRMGAYVVAIGDPDGDGRSAVALQVSSSDVCSTAVIDVAVGGTYDLDNAATACFWEAYAFHRAGAPGDLSGDGTVDAVLSLVEPSVGTGYAAGVFAVPSAGIVDAGAQLATVEIEGGPQYGVVDASGDLDGDGIDDLVVGMRGATADADSGGSVRVYSGPLAGTVLLAEATWSVVGEVEREYLGSGVAVLGDVDGDGLADLAAGAQGDDPGDEGDMDGEYAGTVRVWRGPPDASAGHDDTMALLVGDTGWSFGYCVAAPGDMDGDGLADLLAGSLAGPDGSSGQERGAVSIAYSPLSGTLTPAEWSATLLGPDDGNGYWRTGRGCSAAGDVNNDGAADVLLGSSEDGYYPDDYPAPYYIVLGVGD